MLPAAGDEDPAVRPVHAAYFGDAVANIALGGDEKDFVFRLDHGGPFGNDWPVLAENRRHPGVHCRHVLPQQADFLANEWAAVDCLDTDKPHPAVGEIKHLQGAGQIDQALYVFRNDHFRADRGIARDALLAEQLVAETYIGGRMDAADILPWCGTGMGDPAGHHVQLVVLGDRDQQVGVYRAGLLKHVGMRAAAADDLDVMPRLSPSRRASSLSTRVTSFDSVDSIPARLIPPGSRRER